MIQLGVGAYQYGVENDEGSDAEPGEQGPDAHCWWKTEGFEVESCVFIQCFSAGQWVDGKAG